MVLQRRTVQCHLALFSIKLLSTDNKRRSSCSLIRNKVVGAVQHKCTCPFECQCHLNNEFSKSLVSVQQKRSQPQRPASENLCSPKPVGNIYCCTPCYSFFYLVKIYKALASLFREKFVTNAELGGKL